MRVLLAALSLLFLSGCTSMLVGGGGYQLGKDERAPSVVASDAEVTSQIKNRYAADSNVSTFKIGVKTYKGIVTLTGTVGSYVARDHAGKLAKETAGVTSVNNQLVVEN